MRFSLYMVVMLLSMTSVTEAAILCAKKDKEGNPSGTLAVRQTCRKNETPLDPKVLELQSTRCPLNSIEVGQLCVDTYEASIWETTDPGTVEKIRDGLITSAAELAGNATLRGATVDDYYPNCPQTAQGCMHFYAVSIPDVIPSRKLSWFQAAAACRNAGKRLLTNAEWQAAALGTPDPGADNGTTDCNTTTTTATLPEDPVLTGSRTHCVSNVGAFDMVGNLEEWTADWMPQATSCPGWGAGGPDDSLCLGWEPGTILGVGPVIRGGSFEAISATEAGVFAARGGLSPFEFTAGRLGFRCGRPK